MNKDQKIRLIIQLKEQMDTLIHQKHHALAQQYDLSLEQYHLLIELDELMLDVSDESNAPTVGKIAKNINNSQNTTSEKVTRLENKGLVRRVRDTNDKRVSRVLLTEQGRALIDAIGKQANNNFLFLSIANLEDQEIDLLLGCYEKLIVQMKEHT